MTSIQDKIKRKERLDNLNPTSGRRERTVFEESETASEAIEKIRKSRVGQGED